MYLPSCKVNSYPPSFNIRKSAQVVAFFAMKEGGKINIVKAMKLVYLADRQSVKDYGFPILDEPRFSMKNGPINSYTYDFAGGETKTEGTEWANYLEDRANNEIASKKNISYDDFDELSKADLSCLNQVWDMVGHMRTWDLVDWVYDKKNVPEWENPLESGAKSLGIPLSRILLNVGCQDPDEQLKVIEGYQEIDNIFEELRTR